MADYDGDTLTWAWSEGEFKYCGKAQFLQMLEEIRRHFLQWFFPLGLSLGLHLLTLSIDDSHNPIVSCSLKVNAIDTIAPTMTPIATPAILWPPNHEMVDVVIETNAIDNNGQPVILSVDQISSTENPDKDGDGNTDPHLASDGDRSREWYYLSSATFRTFRKGKGPDLHGSHSSYGFFW